MDPNEINPDDEELFDQWKSDCRFDDAVSQTHQKELREKALLAFDDSLIQSAVAQPANTSPESKSWLTTRWIGIAVATAVCLLVIGSLLFPLGNTQIVDPIDDDRPETADAIDPILLASIAEVEALSDEASAETFFVALAMCDQESKARQIESRHREARLMYESSIQSPSVPSFPVESPRG